MEVNNKMCLCDKLYIYTLLLSVTINTIDVKCIPTNNHITVAKTWPKMKNYDIWGQLSSERYKTSLTTSITDNDIVVFQNNNNNVTGNRHGKGKGN